MFTFVGILTVFHLTMYIYMRYNRRGKLGEKITLSVFMLSLKRRQTVRQIS